MRLTRRGWATAAATSLVAILAAVLGSPLVLATPVALAATLLAAQYTFVRDLQTTRDALTVTQSVTPGHVHTGQPTTLTVQAETNTVLPFPLTITPRPPATLATADAPRCQMAQERRVVTDIQVTPDAAGRFTLPAATVTATDRLGFFAETFPHGSAATLVVGPRTTRGLHVGEGGDRIAAAYGEHPAGQSGAGLDPAELRQYLPGDPTNRIDWKATARLNEPHVREFDAETDRETILVVDHRHAMADGPAGARKLDDARELALAFVESAQTISDPVGYYAVGDGGLTDAITPGASASQYRTITTRLHDLTPTTPSHTTTESRSPATAARTARTLAADDTAFGETLAPYFDTPTADVTQLEAQPLFGAVQRHVTETGGRPWTVIVTDDTHPGEIRETVKYARHAGGHVLVCLLPSVLYAPGGLTDLDDAYARYRDFEEFRRSLARIEGVRALEVGPRDRLTAVLDHGTTRRTPGGTP